MADDKGYKDTKEFTCVSCGKTIILTKFASQKTCKCEECKAINAPINPDIVTQALAKNPPKERKKSTGPTKMCRCTQCGEFVEVSKFMSEAKVLCDTCKGLVPKADKNLPKMEINKGKLVQVTKDLGDITDYEVNSGVIMNQNLRQVECPACHHKYLKPLMIVDWSQYGLIIDYQCQSCLLKVTISEQCRRPMKIYNLGKRFDYTGRQIRELGLSWANSSRLANSLCTLIHKCEELGIDVDKELTEEAPPYRWNNDKPVPTGFVIPNEDKYMKTVQDAIDTIEAPLNATEDNCISISTDDAKVIIDKLKSLFKKEDINGINE